MIRRFLRIENPTMAHASGIRFDVREVDADADPERVAF